MQLTIKAAYITGAFVLIGALLTSWLNMGSNPMSMTNSDNSLLANIDGNSHSIHIGNINNSPTSPLSLEEIKKLGIKEYAIEQFLEDMGIDLKNSSPEEIEKALKTVKKNLVKLELKAKKFQADAQESEIQTPDINNLIKEGNFDEAEKSLNSFSNNNIDKSIKHILTAAGAWALNANIAESRFQYNKAVQYYDKAYRNAKKLGDSHIKVWAGYLIDKGRLQLSTGNTDNAIYSFEEALSHQERVLGKNNPETVGCLGCMASAYLKKGNLKKAESLSRLALDISIKKYGMNHADTAFALFTAARVAFAKDDFEKAVSLLKDALTIVERNGSSEPVSKISTLFHLAGSLSHLGKNEEALTYMEKAYKLQKTVNSIDAPFTAQIEANLGLLYNHLGYKKRSLEYLDQSKFTAIKGGNEDNHFVQEHIKTIENLQCKP